MNSPQFGVSYSVKATRQYGMDSSEVLDAILSDLGVRRLRLMSYWDEIEQSPGIYDYVELDSQFRLAKKHNADVSLCIGMRQPRWPETHIPEWAKALSPIQREQSLNTFLSNVINRYQDHPSLVSWQLENEALNRSFGLDGDFSRVRLRSEYLLVKSLDKYHPIIMSTSNSWGIPLRQPIPDIVGFSMYRVMHLHDNYSRAKKPAALYRLRAALIFLLLRRQSYIHELQLEPWGPKSNENLDPNESNQSMDLRQFNYNVAYAKKTNLYPIDAWGAEWWYWMMHRQGDARYWNEARKLFL